MFSAGLTLSRYTVDALFGIAAAALLLLLIGIHNAWDSVTYIAAENTPLNARLKQEADVSAPEQIS